MKVGLVIALVVVAAIWGQPVLAADAAVEKAFAEAEKYAATQKEATNDKDSEANKQADEGIKQIKAITSRLNAKQLVELIRLSDKRMAQEFKYPPPYLEYFESVIHFSIRRLGRMTTPDAVKALNDVPKIILVDASMGLVYDEAKEEQAKLLQAKHH